MWELYWLTRLNAVLAAASGVMTIAALIGFVAGTFFIIGIADDFEKEVKSLINKILVTCLVVTGVSGTVLVLTPTQKDVAIILGGYWVTNSEEIKKLPANVAKTMNDFLERYQDEKEEKK